MCACALIASMYFSSMHGSDRSEALKAKCASNLKSIGAAFVAYSNNHNRRYPDSIESLFLESGLPAETLCCPASNDFRADGTREEQAASFSKGGTYSYIYLAKGLTNAATRNDVLMYEPLANHHNKGIHLLFADYHVEWLKTADAQKFLASLKPGQPAVWPIPNGK